MVQWYRLPIAINAQLVCTSISILTWAAIDLFRQPSTNRHHHYTMATLMMSQNTKSGTPKPSTQRYFSTFTNSADSINDKPTHIEIELSCRTFTTNKTNLPTNSMSNVNYNTKRTVSWNDTSMTNIQYSIVERSLKKRRLLWLIWALKSTCCVKIDTWIEMSGKCRKPSKWSKIILQLTKSMSEIKA